MASLPEVSLPVGRNFTASELVGKRITAALSLGGACLVLADGELIENACKFVLTAESYSITEAILTLRRPDQTTEEVTLRDHLQFAFASVVTEVE